jgi:hypothetical protein
MNCANHADASAVAYCRTCGKALCNNCTRPVRGVIYCEDCLGARMEGTVPPIPPVPPVPPPPVSYVVPPAGAIPNAPGAGAVPNPPGTSSGPNPTVAGILGGFFPFGVGAVYTGQYAKGLAHLAIFALLIAGVSASDHSGSEVLGPVCGILIGFFYFYQIIDSVRSARALQMGQPAPDPFGLARTFSLSSAGEKFDTSKVPTGAIVLIILGVFFLLRTAGLFEFGAVPVIGALLILLGCWIFVTRWGLFGTTTMCTCERCRSRALMGPAMLVTVGIIILIDNFRHVGFFGYLGGILLVIGGVKLFQGGASSEGHRELPNPNQPSTVPPSAPSTPVSSAPPNEVNRG